MDKHYNIKPIMSTNAEYYIINGARSNGKSYAVKKLCYDNFMKTGKKFIYLRRFKEDTTIANCDQYFSDPGTTVIEKIFKDGDCFSFYNQKIYLSKSDEETGKCKKIKEVGYIRSLTSQQHYKSSSFDDVNMIIFEEYISDTYYLPNEISKFNSFVSTVARNRKIKVFLIGNVISRINPYVRDWDLRGIFKQKQGTIDIYNKKDANGENHKIAVELCAETEEQGKMAFGHASSTVNKGEWDTVVSPKLSDNYPDDYNICCRYIIKMINLQFFAEFLQNKKTNIYTWYIYPKTTPETRLKDRVITDNIFDLKSEYDTLGFKALTANEQKIFDMLKNGWIKYSDDLTATDFQNCIKNGVI